MATRVTAFGGVNEIGGNKFLVEEGEERVLMDFGTSIGARGRFFEEFLNPRTNSFLRDLLRLDLVPRIDGLYRDDFLTLAKVASDGDVPESAAAWRGRHGGRNAVGGIILTHAHIDHFQDLAFVDPEIPVFCSATTRRMLEVFEAVASRDIENEITQVRWRSLGAHGASSTFPNSRKVVTDLRARRFIEVDENVPFRVGSFQALLVPVDHSVPGACAAVLRTQSRKTIFYTGDVRFHGRLMDRTRALQDAVKGLEPDLMLCEGTRIAEDIRDNEEDVERGVASLVDASPGLVVTEFAWKDTTRFDTIQRVAAASGRQLLVDPRLALLAKRIAGLQGVPTRPIEEYGNVAVYRRRRGSMMGDPADYETWEAGYQMDWGERSTAMKRAWADRDETFLADGLAHYRRGITAEEVRAHPSRYIVHLTYWSSPELFDLAPGPGASWVRCQTEPYSEEMALSLDRQRAWLDQFGMAHNLRASKRGAAPAGPLVEDGVVTHVSGHAAGVDLRALVDAARPRTLVPIHVARTHLDRFDAWSKDLRRWPDATPRAIARGDCVVDL
ncbi:MAG: MBL fold metallo-hydrolase [Thermoplasmatota archaeon]